MSEKQLPMPSATVTTQVDLKPQGSQTLLMGMIVLSGLSMGLGAMLLGMGKDAGWAFAVFSLPLAGIAAKGWFAAHADADLNDAKPTIISSTVNGLTASTDSRTLRSPTAAQAFAQLVTEVSQRQKLPSADGIVENGVVIPDSAAAADVRVQQVNALVDDQVKNLDAILNPGQGGPAAIQRPAELVIPHDESTSRLNTSASA